MDNLQSELYIPDADLNDETSEDERSHTSVKQAGLLLVYPIKGTKMCKESGFHKTTRLCLQAIRDALLHHRWQEAVQYLDVYTQTLEDTTVSKQSVACEIIWRLGTEVLQHHPKKELEHFNVLYERMKNTGVKNFAKICLEHAFHLLLNGQIHNAKQQLSVAMSWRYGKHSASQGLELKLIHAYCGFLDYLLWSSKRQAFSDTEDCGNNHEMHSHFRQASVTLQEIIKQPGVWDPFVYGCVDMLEFYNDEEEALKLLQNYAYNDEFPSNPNAHIYLYKHQLRHKASPAQLIKTLKVLHSLVPSHELMLEYCTLLIKSGQQKNLQHALSVAMNLLEHACWKTDVKAWTCLLHVLSCVKRRKNLKKLIKEEWQRRKDLWLKMHFKTFHSRKDSEALMSVKVKVLLRVGLYNTRYSMKYYKDQKKMMAQQEKSEEHDVLKVKGNKGKISEKARKRKKK
ncbi:TATA box-binding protein-associated factor RNA polymerase I subunit A isoform X2 [Ictalurus furcatus]|uniref:TATA box-binding protein-associated factor RNA polymerase I subunit A isoform X2 n=1 Tax=Ictalurus furcatus TaxID=66913 RepID=UPI0023509E8E|nr:TATA box-binding protein-associated factor RNA polymerase I subunit A isoform X2 [Ictalurus furcatus]